MFYASVVWMCNWNVSGFYFIENSNPSAWLLRQAVTTKDQVGLRDLNGIKKNFNPSGLDTDMILVQTFNLKQYMYN